MKPEDVVAKIQTGMSRRKFLSKIGAAAAAGTAFITNSRSAAASEYYHWQCCTLCKPNIGSPACLGQGCTCVWGWSCINNGIHYQCGECYGPGAGCGGSCDVKCSFGYQLGSRAPV